MSVNRQSDKLYREKLTFKPAKLNPGGKRPATIELSEKQIETKLFQKHGFNPNNPTQLETLKLRFDTGQVKALLKFAQNTRFGRRFEQNL